MFGKNGKLQLLNLVSEWHVCLDGKLHRMCYFITI